jgi:hypothetical protein
MQVHAGVQRLLYTNTYTCTLLSLQMYITGPLRLTALWSELGSYLGISVHTILWNVS